MKLECRVETGCIRPIKALPHRSRGGRDVAPAPPAWTRGKARTRAPTRHDLQQIPVAGDGRGPGDGVLLGPRCLRHPYLLLEKTWTSRPSAERLGRSSVAITTTHSHPTRRKDRAAVQVWDDLMQRARGGRPRPSFEGLYERRTAASRSRSLGMDYARTWRELRMGVRHKSEARGAT